MPPVIVSIIGSAGRKDDGPRMSGELQQSMVLKAEEIINTDWGLKYVPSLTFLLHPHKP